MFPNFLRPTAMMRPAAMMRTVAMMLLVTTSAEAMAYQATDPHASLPVYDVSSVKPTRPDTTDRDSSFNSSARYTGKNLDIMDLLRTSFGMQEYLILGLPDWSRKQRFDLEAKVSDLDPEAAKNLTLDQRREMLRTVIEERFHLKWHRETREMPIYELQVSKTGSKLALTTTKGTMSGIRNRGNEMDGMNCAMSVLAGALSNRVNRAVVDKTYLKGRYDFTLKFTPDDQPASADNDSPSLFTAMPEQLGLKLQPARGMLTVLVIDSVSMPTTD